MGANTSLDEALQDLFKAKPRYSPMNEWFLSGPGPTQNGLVEACTWLKLVDQGESFTLCENMMKYLAEHNCLTKFPKETEVFGYLFERTLCDTLKGSRANGWPLKSF